ncbi:MULTISPECIES: DUF4199 domain-containing protein [unclassified Polaribacter]|uniref:DUF4199 domain-containing protein n=1 Tax=unclassified Polaribacter TaxID=196858 RepID=UPI0011BD8D08|nr:MULTISPECIES: DUF4199 domain-containing protein [unclassified Polaribacter]TXD52984.1 DUF4199 domain-containing protein [Polaribacter sp. IC063]TXD60924.1 DUF4199 domain-containing protein [Polaribacter sp. IC066]
MENQASSKSIILNYGLYLGLITILTGLVKYATGNLYVTEFYSGILGVLIVIVFVILGIKNFKATNKGLIGFGEAVKIGVGLTLIGTILIIAYYFLLSTVIEPDFMANTMEAQKVMFADSFGMTEGQIEEATKNSEDNFYLSLFGGILVWNLFLGGITSLITAAVVKKTEEDSY